jgi:2-polyprenyl-3-methyl-5-hydroxy-6-metoxy-1,4-benzoquinol methylase
MGKIRPWGEEVWEKKIKSQDERGVIHGRRFSRIRGITDNTKNEALEYLERKAFPIIGKSAKVMDAGIGPLARFSIEFSKRGYKVLGVDVSQTTLDYASRHIKSSGVNVIRLVKDDLTSLKKVPGEFDFIFCYGTFGHIPKILALETLRNFYSKLKKGGICFIHFWLETDNPLKSKLKEAFYEGLHRLGKGLSKGVYVNCSYYSREELKDLFYRSKFRVVDEGKGGFFLLGK